MDKIVLIKLLEFARDLNSINEVVNTFRLLSRKHKALLESRDGKINVVSALRLLGLTPAELDANVIRCIRAKNAFMLEMFLSVPDADPELLVHKKSYWNGGKFITVRKTNFKHWELVVNEQGRLSPLLHFVIQEQWPEGVQVLLARGAQMDSEGYETQYVEAHYGRCVVLNNFEFFACGRRPLHVAVEARNHAAVTLLLERDVDLESKTKSGETPLKVGIRNQNSEAIALLIAKGVSVADEEDLYLALRYSELQVVKEFIQRNPAVIHDPKTIKKMADNVQICKDAHSNPKTFIPKVLALLPDAVMQKQFLQHMILKAVAWGQFKLAKRLLLKSQELTFTLEFDPLRDIPAACLKHVVQTEKFKELEDNGNRLFVFCQKQLTKKLTFLEEKELLIKKIHALIEDVGAYLATEIKKPSTDSTRYLYLSDLARRIAIKKGVLDSIKLKPGFRDLDEEDSAENFVSAAKQIMKDLHVLAQPIMLEKVLKQYYQHDRGLFRRYAPLIPRETRTIKELKALSKSRKVVTKDQIVKVLTDRDTRSSRFRKTGIQNAVRFFQDPTQQANPKKLSATDRVIIKLRDAFDENPPYLGNNGQLTQFR